MKKSHYKVGSEICIIKWEFCESVHDPTRSQVSSKNTLQKCQVKMPDRNRTDTVQIVGKSLTIYSNSIHSDKNFTKAAYRPTGGQRVGERTPPKGGRLDSVSVCVRGLWWGGVLVSPVGGRLGGSASVRGSVSARQESAFYII